MRHDPPQEKRDWAKAFMAGQPWRPPTESEVARARQREQQESAVRQGVPLTEVQALCPVGRLTADGQKWRDGGQEAWAVPIGSWMVAPGHIAPFLPQLHLEDPLTKRLLPLTPENTGPLYFFTPETRALFESNQGAERVWAQEKGVVDVVMWRKGGFTAAASFKLAHEVPSSDEGKLWAWNPRGRQMIVPNRWEPELAANGQVNRLWYRENTTAGDCGLPFLDAFGRVVAIHTNGNVMCPAVGRGHEVGNAMTVLVGRPVDPNA